MSRRCSLCTRSDREITDALLITNPGLSLRDKARRLQVSKDTVAKHQAEHIPKRLAWQARRIEAAHDRSLADRLVAYTETLLRVADRAEQEGNLRVVVSAHRELARLAELEARSHGELRAPATGNVTNVQVLNVSQPFTAEDHQQALREARLLLEFEEDERRDRRAHLSVGPAP